MSLRALIIDDEFLARTRVRMLLDQEGDIEVVGECANGIEAVSAIECLKPDLVFLDIQMPGLDGFGVIESIGSDRMPATLFITSYDQFACRAFEAQALDYLLKPLEENRFAAALARVRRWCQPGAAPSREFGQRLSHLKADRPWLDRILVKQDDAHLLVKSRSIQWIESEGNYLRLHLEGTSHLVRQPLSRLLQRLNPEQFRRVHRSAAVNLDYVVRILHSVQGDHEVQMKDGTRLPCSRGFRQTFGDFTPGGLEEGLQED